MSYLLEILGRGLLAELASAFREVLRDDSNRSTEQLQSLAANDRDDDDLQQALGVRYLTERQLVRARKLFQAILTDTPKNHPARVGLACALDLQGLTADAAGELQTALHAKPDDAATLFGLGFCREKLGDLDGALAAYESTVDIAPQLRNAHERLAAIYFKLDRTDMAIKHYEHLAWCEPGDTAVSLTLANLYVRVGRHEDAIRRYEFALSIDPDHWNVQDDLVTACVDTRQFDTAISTLKGMIEQRPECADQHIALGDIYEQIGRNNDSLDAYACAVRNEPDSLEASIKYGTGLLRCGDFQDAARVFSNAIELNDRILAACVGLGVAQLALGKTEAASNTFDLAKEVEPNSTMLFGEVARLQLKVNAADYRQRLNTTHGQSATNAVDKLPHAAESAESAESAENLIDQQIQALKLATKAYPLHADVYYRLGLLLRHREDLTGAISAFFQAVTINPNYLKALIKLGLALRESGRHEQSVATFKRALEVDPQSIDLHYQLGLTFADQGQFSLAVDQFQQALDHDPTKLEYLANLALSLQDMGLLDRADAAWQTLGETATETPQGRSLLDTLCRSEQLGPR